MKVHTVTRVNPAQQIAEGGLTPVSKVVIENAGKDATLQAMSTVQEVLAHVKEDDRFWFGMGKRIIEGTTDFRAQFVKQLNAALKDMRANNAQALDGSVNSDGKPDPSKDARKQASKNVAAVGVNVSRLRTLATAFNGAATVSGLIEFYVSQGKAKSDGITLDHVSWTVMHQYAVTFSEAKAGRPKHTWLQKFGKFLESTGKLDEDASKEEQAQYAQVMALYNKLSAVASKVDAAPV